MKNKIENWEKAFFDWLVLSRYKIVFLLLVSIIIIFVSFLPYINLIIAKELVPIVIFIAAIFILGLDEEKIIKFGLLIFVVTLFFYLIDRLETAEILANYIYLILLTAVIKSIFSLKDRDKQNN